MNFLTTHIHRDPTDRRVMRGARTTLIALALTVGSEAGVQSTAQGVPNAMQGTATNLITMQGGVVLTQCANVLRSDRLVVDMTTGVSRLESNSGKVRALLAQSAPGCASPVPAPNPRPG
jgi:hypothetical protein